MEKFQKLPFDNREIDWRILVQDHITAANYGIAGALGTAPPAGFLSGDKSKVLQAMKDSFAHFRNAIVALNDADTAKPQKMFNRETTLRGFFIIITGHFGEHLGQSIAYARLKGIVPPWTEAAQQQTKSRWRKRSRRTLADRAIR